MENSEYLLSAGLEFFCALVSIILLMGCLLDHDRKRKNNRIMIVILSVHTVMNALDACIWLWCDEPNLLVLMKILSFLSYFLGSVSIMLFSYLLTNYIRGFATIGRWADRAVITAGGIMTSLWVVSLFNGMYYYWDENGICRLGDLFWLSQVFGVLFFLFNIALVLISGKALTKKDATVLILYNIIPLLSYLLIPLWDVTPIYASTTIVLLIYYIIIHVEHGQRAAEQEVKLVKQELELTNSRTAIVLTQIRPHFLYNSLTAIAQLCEKDPKKARAITLNFSEYLRSNMNSLDQKNPVSFRKELETVKNYLAIEQVRFGEMLRIVYDIQTSDFMLPALSLQPIVENAVKHGVGMKEEGGTVTISSGETEKAYVITVSDDGVGFDTSREIDDGKKHIGMNLVRVRLEKLVGGTMTVESRINEGTSVAISIPKGAEI